MNNANWVDIGMLFLTLLGGGFALLQWVNSNKIRRSEFINQIINKLRFNEDMVMTMYKNEYDDNWYNEDFHNSQETEYQIDKLLSYLSYICYLKDAKIIKEKEFSIFIYELNRTCNSTCVREYLWNLNQFSIANKTPCSFIELINYGISSKIFNDDFNNPNSNIYRKFLNF